MGLLRRVRGSSATARAVFIPAFAVAVVAFQSFTYLCVETGHFLAALGAAWTAGWLVAALSCVSVSRRPTYL